MLETCCHGHSCPPAAVGATTRHHPDQRLWRTARGPCPAHLVVAPTLCQNRCWLQGYDSKELQPACQWSFHLRDCYLDGQCLMRCHDSPAHPRQKKRAIRYSTRCLEKAPSAASPPWVQALRHDTTNVVPPWAAHHCEIRHFGTFAIPSSRVPLRTPTRARRLARWTVPLPTLR